MSDSNSTITGANSGVNDSTAGSSANSESTGADSSSNSTQTDTISGSAAVPDSTTINVDSTGNNASNDVETVSGANNTKQVSSVTKTPVPPVKQQVSSVTKTPAVEPPQVDASPVLTQQQINDNRQLSIIQELLTNIKTRLSAKIGTDANFQLSATDLSNVFLRILANPTKESLDCVWNFFVENMNGVMVETIALKGIEVLAPNVRSRVEFTYMLFRKATKGIDILNANLVNQNVLKNIIKSPKFVTYLSTQSKTVVVPN